jgi:hypothetical protein
VLVTSRKLRSSSLDLLLEVVPSSLAAVAVLEPQHGGEFRVVDFDRRLGAVDDRADQDALFALVERGGARGGVGFGSHGFRLRV